MTDTAYYYPEPYWGTGESSWVKSLLLFFDEVAILLPSYMRRRPMDADLTLVEPLQDRGLLKILEPNDWVDVEIATQLSNVMVGLLANGVFDNLPETNYFAELSQSRMGYGADVELGNSLVEELRKKGVARPSEDGVSIPLHPTVRTTILVILAQLSRTAGDRRGMAVHPTTSHPLAVRDLVEMLSREAMPSRDNIIKLDVEPVSFDLDAVPLDDVLQFRVEYQDAHRAYMRDLIGFMYELAGIDNPEEREVKLLERRQEIADAAHDIQRFTRRALGKNVASWSLGIVGGAWASVTGDPISLVLTAAGLINESISGSHKMVSAYSYLFQANRMFAG